MSQTYTSPAQALNALRTLLAKVPSPGLGLLLNDVFAIGLPVSIQTQQGRHEGAARIAREGITLALADVPIDEGVVGHELSHVLLETRGWPRLITDYASGHWADRALRTLVSHLDHACGQAMQKAYGVDPSTFEAILLEPADQRVAKLLRQAHLLPTLTLSPQQQVEFAVGVALGALEQYWRRGRVPESHERALSLLTGAEDLFQDLLDGVPAEPPMSGWESRQLMAGLIRLIDDFAVEICGARPLQAASQFVPGLHPADADATTGTAAVVETVPTPSGEPAIQVTNRRDGLSFRLRGSDPGGASVAAMQAQPFAQFCRAQVPKAILIWQPSGSADDRIL